jgi:endonuclease/exonuclease/phosphatase family metal-dependent hydrolase
VATFNVEWLGDGVNDTKPRTDGEYMRIADIIIKTGADVVGLQEIENQAALNKVLRFLKQEHEYEGIVLEGYGGQQHAGVMWKKSITVTPKGAYTPLVTEAGRSRPGFVVECKKGDFDWVMMVVHL